VLCRISSRAWALNLDFSDEQKLLQKVARDFLWTHAPLGAVRRMLDPQHHRDRSLWKAIGDLGWLGAGLPEEFGGGGLGCLELAVIAEELGRALTPVPFSSSVYLASEAILRAGDPDQKQRYLAGLASGASIATFALAEPATAHALTGLQTQFDGARLHGRKAPVPDGAIADIAVVVARGSGGLPCLAVVDLSQPQVKRRTLRGIDDSRPQAVVEFEGAPAELLAGTADIGELVAQLVDRAAVLIAFEQLGGAQACLDMAREYALSRTAFGRPIGSFQALKHRMADMFTAIETARSNCYYGAWALSSGSEELPVAACISRISATEAFGLCAEENLHLHGGIGCTWEFDCHLYVRRAKLLAQSVGPASMWKERLIERLGTAAFGQPANQPQQVA